MYGLIYLKFGTV